MRNPPRDSWRPPVSPMRWLSHSAMSTEGLLTSEWLRLTMSFSQSGVALFPGSDADHVGDGIDENLSVADFAGASGGDDGRHGRLAVRLTDAHPHHHLGDKSRVQLGPAVPRAVPELLAESFAIHRGR